MSLIPSTTYFDGAISVQCGNRANHRSGKPEWHDGGIVAVKACYGFTSLCGWQSQHGYDEDGEATIVECFGEVIETPRGHTCTSGHEYVSMQARHDEGWDYAADEGEAKLLSEYGTQAVAMNGGSI